MTVQIVITGENGLDAASQLRNFIVGLHPANPIPTAEQAKEGVVADKKTDAAPAKKAAPKKAVEEDEEEDALPVKEAAPKKQVEADDEEEDEAPKKKIAPKKTAEEDDEEEAPVKKKKAAEPAKLKELVDDGEEQPATVDGCRVMIRRVARAKGAGSDHAQAVLAEFGVAGASKVPEKKMQAFIDRCQEVIEDPDSIEVA